MIRTLSQIPVKNPSEAIIGNAAIKSTSRQGPLKYDNLNIYILIKNHRRRHNQQ